MKDKMLANQIKESFKILLFYGIKYSESTECSL